MERLLSKHHEASSGLGFIGDAKIVMYNMSPRRRVQVALHKKVKQKIIELEEKGSGTFGVNQW